MENDNIAVPYPKLEPYMTDKSKFLMVSYRIDGKKYQRNTKQTSKVKARSAAREIFKSHYISEHNKKAAEEAAANPPAAKFAGTQITFAEALEDFLEFKGKEISEGSLSSYETLSRKLRGFQLDGKGIRSETEFKLAEDTDNIDTITQYQVNQFIENLKVDFNCSHAAQIHVRRLQIIIDYWTESLLQPDDSRQPRYAFNPAINTAEYTGKRSKKHFEKAVTRDRMLTDDQIDEALVITRNKNKPSYTAIILILRDIGLRIHECVSLEWDQIDLQNKTMDTVRGKGSDDNTVYMTDRLVIALKELRASHNHPTFLFPSKKGSASGHVSPNNLKWFHNILKQLPSGDPNANTTQKIGFHSIRHQYLTEGSTLLTESQLSSVSGHKSVNNLRGYIHNDPLQNSKVIAEHRNRQEQLKAMDAGEAANEEANNVSFPVLLKWGKV